MSGEQFGGVRGTGGGCRNTLNLEIFAFSGFRRFRNGHGRRLRQDYGKVDSVKTPNFASSQGTLDFSRYGMFLATPGGILYYAHGT